MTTQGHPLSVSAALEQRHSCRAFKPDSVRAEVVRDILTRAARAPSGGNLQPWRVYALAGEALAAFKAKARTVALAGGEAPEYAVYPANLWEPYRTRRFACGEALYGSVEIPREDKAGRLAQFARNAEFFGAPVGLFVCIDRRMGPPQWADLGFYMQSVLLLAEERGLSTCAQEFWSRFPRTIAEFVGLPDDHMVFSGIALGYGEPSAPINAWRTERDDFAIWGEMRGF